MPSYSFPITANVSATLRQWATVLRKKLEQIEVDPPVTFIPLMQTTAGGTITTVTLRDCYKQAENNKLYFSLDFSVNWTVAGPELKVIFPFEELSNTSWSGYGGTLYSSGGTLPTALLGYAPSGNNGLFIRRYDNSNFAVGTHAYYMTGFYFYE